MGVAQDSVAPTCTVKSLLQESSITMTEPHRQPLDMFLRTQVTIGQRKEHGSVLMTETQFKLSHSS